MSMSPSPRSRLVKAGVITALIIVAVFVLFTTVFPFIEARFESPTIGAPSPAAHVVEFYS